MLRQKVSKSFKDRQLPSLLSTQNSKYNPRNQNCEIPLYETRGLRKLSNCNPTQKLQPIKLLGKESVSIMPTETKLTEFINKQSQRLKLKKQKRLVIDSALINGTLRKQLPPTNMRDIQKTIESTDGEFDSTRTENRKRKKNKTKTDIAQQILSQIKKSMTPPLRSNSAIGGYKKKRAIDECKVIQIPWGLKTGEKSKSKTEFTLMQSMIKQNISNGPRDSLKQILQQIK